MRIRQLLHIYIITFYLHDEIAHNNRNICWQNLVCVLSIFYHKNIDVSTVEAEAILSVIVPLSVGTCMYIRSTQFGGTQCNEFYELFNRIDLHVL